VFGFLAARRRELFPDELFADLFPTGRGRPSVPADVMAAVITLQALHGLSDSETVDAVTFDLRWKTACGMAVTDGAFHPTTLTYWRRLTRRPALRLRWSAARNDRIATSWSLDSAATSVNGNGRYGSRVGRLVWVGSSIAQKRTRVVAADTHVCPR
jgi:Transposase domain (DUF772)